MPIVRMLSIVYCSKNIISIKGRISIFFGVLNFKGKNANIPLTLTLPVLHGFSIIILQRGKCNRRSKTLLGCVCVREMLENSQSIRVKFFAEAFINMGSELNITLGCGIVKNALKYHSNPTWKKIQKIIIEKSVTL